MIRLSEVREKCLAGRFFAYDDWRDKLFVPPSIILVWIFVNLGWSGNAVSWLSGAVTIIGGCLIATNDRILILLGACSYSLYYLLDYVDGGVARYKNVGGIEGQYVDWMMHVVAALAITAGIFIGAFNNNGQPIWLVPFGILFILAAALQLDRFAMGWWAICMDRQQRLVNARSRTMAGSSKLGRGVSRKDQPMIWKIVGIISRYAFHENNAIFLLPVLAILNLFIAGTYYVDFRMILTVLGGTVYILYVTHDVDWISRNAKLKTAYDRLFDLPETPDLPGDHFFE
jgi:hypothetical protein